MRRRFPKLKLFKTCMLIALLIDWTLEYGILHFTGINSIFSGIISLGVNFSSPFFGYKCVLWHNSTIWFSLKFVIVIFEALKIYNFKGFFDFRWKFWVLAVRVNICSSSIKKNKITFLIKTLLSFVQETWSFQDMYIL